MIAFLEGEVVDIGPGRLVLDVAGVGYELAVPTSLLSALPPAGGRARVHTRMVVREDSMTLYGFSAPDKRELFDLLTGVTGVGPKGPAGGAHFRSAPTWLRIAFEIGAMRSRSRMCAAMLSAVAPALIPGPAVAPEGSAISSDAYRVGLNGFTCASRATFCEPTIAYP